MASYGAIGSVILLGGAGYLVDRYLDTGPWAYSSDCSPVSPSGSISSRKFSAAEPPLP